MKTFVKLFVSFVLVVATAALSFSAARTLEEYLNFYGGNKVYCDDVRKDVPLNKSRKAKESVNKLLLNLTEYAVNYHGEKAFHKTPYLITEMNNTRRAYENMRDGEIYFCNLAIEENKIKKEYVDKGYIVLSDEGVKNVTYEGRSYYAFADVEKIRKDYGEMIEKMVSDIKHYELTYSHLTEYVNELENTEYAVFDKNGKLLISNIDNKTLTEAEEYFNSQKDHISVFKENKDEHAGFSKSFTFLNEGFSFFATDEDYRLFVSINESLDFNGDMAETERFYNETKNNLTKQKSTTVKAFVLCFIFTILTAISVASLIKIKSIKIIFILALLFAAITAVCFFGIISSSHTVVSTLASSDPIKLSAGLSSALIRIMMPVMFLSAQFLIAVLLKRKK